MDDLNHVVNQVEHVFQPISPPQPQPQLQSHLKPNPKLKTQSKP